MGQVVQASVVAHVVVATLQRRGQGAAEGVRDSRAAAATADVHGVGDGVQTAVGERRVCIERVQDLGEAGVQFGFAHVPGGHAVRGVTVTPYFSWKCREGKKRTG